MSSRIWSMPNHHRQKPADHHAADRPFIQCAYDALLALGRLS
jgi:hypothetical protein